MKFAWIHQHRDSFPVSTMCRLLCVSKSGFYQSLKATLSPRAVRSNKIKAAVRILFERSDGIYGSYKIAQQLRADKRLESACRNTVARAMREMGFRSKVSKQFRPTTTMCDPTRRPAANLLSQEFDASAPNEKWVADITYLPTDSGWVYLAIVLDLFSRKVVGWSMSDSLSTPLVASAMKKAIESRKPARHRLLHHSDRGCQYTSEQFQRMLKTSGISCSMSRTGCCYDNAVAERFFWSLKHEWTKFRSFSNLEQARWSVFQYIDTFYNSVRIHQNLNYKSPNQFEHHYAGNQAA